jgi:hypothetical protein
MPSMLDCVRDDAAIWTASHRSIGFVSNSIPRANLLRMDPVMWARSVDISFSKLPSKLELITEAEDWQRRSYRTNVDAMIDIPGDNRLLLAYVRHRYSNYAALNEILNTYASASDQAYQILKTRSIEMVENKITELEE